MRSTPILFASALFLAAATGAQAMPSAGAHGLGLDEAPVTQVRGGCGFGAHRGPYGGCRLNRGPRGDLRRAITGAPRGCPPGRYRTRRGFCR